jgi:hypothetical protein
MKKILAGIAMVLISISGFSQQKEPVQPYTKQGYLQKSKNQKTVGWVLLGVGTAMLVTGILVGSSAEPGEGIMETSTGEDIGIALLVGGLVTDLISIPFFISSANNARKAATLSFNNQKIPVPRVHSIAAKTQPSVTLKIRM